MEPRTGPGDGGGKGIGLVVVALVGVLLLFVALQIIGSPIATFGNPALSALYSVLVYIPPLIVCALALQRSKGRGAQ